MKALKITTDSVISVIDIQEPALEGMQKEVGGYIEHVRPVELYELNVPGKENLCMIVNEDGHFIGLAINLVASSLYNTSCFDWWSVLGNVLILAEGFVDGEPDIVGLDDEQIQALCKELKNKFKFLKEVINE